MYRDYDLLTREFLAALRGTETQSTLSQKLGYRHNKFAKWEGGFNRVLWRDFVKACALTNRDLERALQIHTAFSGNINDTKKILSCLVDKDGLKTSAAVLGASRSTFNRWINGLSDVPLSAVFALLDFYGRLDSFISSLVNLDRIPAFRGLVERRELVRRVLKEFPEASLICSACELKAYRNQKRHCPGFFAARIGLTIEREREALGALESANMLRKVNGKYESMTFAMNMSWNSKETFSINQKIKGHWLRIGAHIAETTTQDKVRSRSGLEVYAVSATTSAQINHEIDAAMRRIYRILATRAKNSAEKLQVFQFQILDFDPPR